MLVTEGYNTAAPLGAMGAKQFCAFASISRMTLWRLIRDGELQQIHIGTKKLVLLSSWNEFVERKLAEEVRHAPAPELPVRRGRGRPRIAR